MKNLNISFDFDGTLSTRKMQILAQKTIDVGAEVFITTSRPRLKNSTYNDDLFAVAQALGIKEKNIRFTNYEPKWSYLKEMDFHIDDSKMEIEEINRSCKCVALQFMGQLKRKLL